LRSNTLQKLGAEFVATFAMVLLGTGAIVLNDVSSGQVGLFGIAFTFGLVIAAMIYLLGPISGAHMNPAVTLALAADKKLPVMLMLPYIFGQCSGAIFASYVLSVFFPRHSTLGATIPQGSLPQSFMVELFLGFVLIFAILQIVKRASVKRLPAALIIGSIIALGAIFAGHISGASMNPVRSLAPAILSSQYHGIWIYLSAPTLGGILAVGFNRFFEKPLEASSPYSTSF
jgi:aquaporin NIP